MNHFLSISDVLDIKYLVKWKWSPDGRHIAFLWDDGGLQDLWLVEPGMSEPRPLTNAKISANDFVWTKSGDIAAVLDSKVALISAGSDFAQVSTLVEGEQIKRISISDDDAFLVFSKADSLWIRNQCLGTLTELIVPGELQPVDRQGDLIKWAPSCREFVFAYRDEESYHQIGVAVISEGKASIKWRSHFRTAAAGLDWLDDDTLIFTQMDPSGLRADLIAMRVPGTDSVPVLKTLLQIKGTGKGSIMFATGTLSPDKRMLLLLLENHGWAHHYLFSLAPKTLKQVTFGECEDFAHAGDSPVWLPDSSGFLFSSNRNEKDQRHIFHYDITHNQCKEIIGLSGTNSMVSISSKGQLAFQHCDEYRNMDIWVSGPRGEDARQVSFSMSPAWTPENQYPSGKITFKSAGGLNISGYLMKPKLVEAGAKLPAVVWVHGGPIRQMRQGWHPLRSYALFHAYNQYLVGQGYVVLSVNFRGGTGYGRAFRESLHLKMGIDDVADVVGAGAYLKGLSFVDPDRLGVYGLSYGGYMTLHCLTQHPHAYKCGINIAGIWDYAQWTKWADKRYGKGLGLFKIALGGEPEAVPQVYRTASPKTYVENMKAPLLNLHGTADMNVDFQQMDQIISDLVEHGKDFEVVYYPKEVHTFAKRKTWMDAMPKMTAFFNKHLKKQV